MIFTELRFVLLVAVCWVSFFGVQRRHRPHVLTFWGVVFYLVFAGRYLPLVVGMLFGVHVLTRRRLSWVALAGVAIVLAYFKFGVLSSGVTPMGVSGAEVLIPLGLSFLAFELIQFTIESRRGRVGQTSLVELAAFAFYFPCRIAGPIKRFSAFKTSIEQAEASIDNIYAGVLRILMGLFKKVVIADVLALTVAELSYASTPGHVWRVVIAYSLQIFFDFSAYSDIAIGVSRVLGIAVPENFRWPYLSPNIQEFWNRWHISLSSWIRDFVFLPMGHALFRTRLRRGPALVATISYLVSFLVIGAWHGLLANYLVWGAYHGLLLAAFHVVRASLPDAIIDSRLYSSSIVKPVWTVVTFVFVTVGWVPFMTNLDNAWRLLQIMFAVA